MSAPGYEIIDPRRRAAEAPYTFLLASLAEIAAVTTGDVVQLPFEYSHDTERWAAERMWVVIDEVNGDSLSGLLENIADEPTSPLGVGDKLSFERHNIIAIKWSNPVAALSVEGQRDYWDRCLVDQCVLVGQEPVEYLYREEPDMTFEDDKYADSGVADPRPQQRGN